MIVKFYEQIIPLRYYTIAFSITSHARDIITACEGLLRQRLVYQLFGLREWQRQISMTRL